MAPGNLTTSHKTHKVLCIQYFYISKKFNDKFFIQSYLCLCSLRGRIELYCHNL